MFARILGDVRGNAAMIMALLTPVVVAIVGAGVDFTRLTFAGSTLQDNADAAAIAATLKLANDPKLNQADVEAYAAQHVQGAFIATRSPFSGAVRAAIESTSPARVRIRLTQEQPMVFGGLFGMPTRVLQRTATAAADKGQPICLLVLDPSAASAWSMKGTGDVVGKKCVSQVNSNSSRALAANGGATVSMVRNYVVGPAQPTRGFAPAPLFDQKAVPDPFAATLPWPTSASCAYSNLGVISKLTINLAPGLICGDLDVASDGVVNLQPGVFTITGDIKLKSGGVLNGVDGATIVLAGPTSTITAQAGGSLMIRAPKSGPWANVAIAIKPQANELQSTLIGGGNTILDGMVYLPTQQLHLTGGAGMDKGESPRSFVVNRLVLNGNGQLYLRSDNSLLVKPETVRLVE